MKKTLKIELMSDLCAGTGKHYAAIIDLDTAIDEYGIPFIPSRRLKGCMREVAELIGSGKIDEIFGKSGQEKGGSLRITDAKIESYEKIATAIKEVKLNHAGVTELFCSVRSEIELSDDVTKDKSLRFIRVVNRLSPIDMKPLVFTAEIEFDESDEEDIKRICKGLKNIGYHRNRGLGAIKCTLADVDEKKINFKDISDDEEYELAYTVYLVSDVMLPSRDTNHTLTYIPGTSVLGALASRYKGDDFNDVFLSGKVKFGNLYVSDEKNTSYIPAPRFLAKVKVATSEEDKGIKNLIAENESREEKGEGKQYKVLKKEYVNPEKGKKEPDTKVVYHNSVRSGDSGLYTQHCLCKGQYFRGAIVADGKYMKKIAPLFESGSISFGRSKTAQYSLCKITDANVTETKAVNKIRLTDKSIAAYVCESDVILTDEDTGVFVTEIDAMLKILGVKKDDLRRETSLATAVISGYNAKWNMKKPQVPVISAGSTIVFTVNGESELKERLIIGEKQNEGFGRVKLIADAKNFVVKDCKDSVAQEVLNDDPFVKMYNERKIDDEIISLAIETGERLRLNASQTGRIFLMCKEAESLDDFIGRIKSIKTKNTMDEAIRYFGKEALEEKLNHVIIAGQDEAYKWVKYKKYIKTALAVRKYKLRGESK